MSFLFSLFLCKHSSIWQERYEKFEEIKEKEEKNEKITTSSSILSILKYLVLLRLKIPNEVQKNSTGN